jgi:hypothetical protein
MLKRGNVPAMMYRSYPFAAMQCCLSFDKVQTATNLNRFSTISALRYDACKGPKDAQSSDFGANPAPSVNIAMAGMAIQYVPTLPMVSLIGALIKGPNERPKTNVVSGPVAIVLDTQK